MEAECILPICTVAHCFDAQLHPREPLLAAATITGNIELHRFVEAPEAPEVAEDDEDDESAEGEGAVRATSELVRNIKSHKESCRTARFMPGGGGAADGARLASAASNGFAAISDLETGTRLWRAKLEAGGNALLPLTSNTFAVGDDDGKLAVYDIRTSKPAVQWAENSDYISDVTVSHNKKSLCVTSGDGTLAVYDMRRSGEDGLIAMSDFLEDEYSCLTVVRDGRKVVCGGLLGVLAIFTWGDFGDMKDRITGPKLSIDAIVKLTEDCVLIGSADGRIRVVSVYHKLHHNFHLGVFGQHGENPVERLAVSGDGRLLASTSHGQPTVRLWHTEVAHKMRNAKKGTTGDLFPPEDDEDAPKKKRRKRKRKAKEYSDVQRKAASFFRGL